jgi:hypothetical protein
MNIFTKIFAADVRFEKVPVKCVDRKMLRTLMLLFEKVQASNIVFVVMVAPGNALEITPEVPTMVHDEESGSNPTLIGFDEFTEEAEEEEKCDTLLVRDSSMPALLNVDELSKQEHSTFVPRLHYFQNRRYSGSSTHTGGFTYVARVGCLVRCFPTDCCGLSTKEAPCQKRLRAFDTHR